ncbi:MAG TPA: DNA methyltransferase [Gemmataceae bacterium]|nr:DNA methyltransferase [Gemmataceae bacterium]
MKPQNGFAARNLNPAAFLSGAIEQVPIESLTADPRNARRHSRKQIRQLARSLETFGFIVPVLADAQGKMIAGHCRLLGAAELGLTHVPVIRIHHLSPAQIRAFMIADNRLSQNSTWDDQLLAEQFKELAELELDFELDVTGFDAPEIDLLIEGLDKGGGEDPEDDAVPPLGSPVSRIGDLWQIGKHRILCGSALHEASYSVLFGDHRAHVVFTDPPYNVEVDGHVSGNGKHKHREFAMASGEMSRAEFSAFLAAALKLMARYSRDGSIHFVCMDWRHMLELLAAGGSVYSETKNICVWAKNRHGMGSFYRSQHEFIVVFKHGKSPHRNNIRLGSYGRNRSNVWRYPGPSAFGRGSEEGNLSAIHPTVKPIAMVADALLDCSARGQIVLDPFLGSGTTLVAAERVGRICYGMDLDPLYVDTAIRRLQRLTGLRATNVVTGETFDSCQSRMEVSHG